MEFDKTELSSHYNSDYSVGQIADAKISGEADARKFSPFIDSDDATVLDFGCGPGGVLRNLTATRKIGVEPNQSLHRILLDSNIEVMSSTAEACELLGEGVCDYIISNHALEHVRNPVQEINNLRYLLKKGGMIILFVPFEGLNNKFEQDDKNRHLYTWSPKNLGNLFLEVGGWDEIDAQKFLPKWPPFHRYIYHMGWPVFESLSAIYGFFSRSVSQCYVKAIKDDISK